MWFLLILCLGLPFSIAINLIYLHRLFFNIYIVVVMVVMVVILKNSSFQLVRCMLRLRDAGKSKNPYAWLLLTVDLMKIIRESTIPYQYFHLFSVAVGSVNIKLINTCGSRLIASRQYNLLTLWAPRVLVPTPSTKGGGRKGPPPVSQEREMLQT